MEEYLVSLVPPHPPLERGHPAGLAAGVFTIAVTPECGDLWGRVLGFLGCRKPNFESRYESANFHFGTPVSQQHRLRVPGE